MIFFMLVFSEGRQHSHIPVIGGDTLETKLGASKRFCDCDRRLFKARSTKSSSTLYRVMVVVLYCVNDRRSMYML